MPLPPNTRLGRYEIRSLLGAGGMGEVYLAEDTRLKRKVALKVLPESLAADVERLLRFEREAFAASALNHPNILTIDAFGKDGTTHFLASEFVQGETLRERFGRTNLTISEKLESAQQIASALQAAHSAGIIHRDIKPENVMIREDGYVKVLDFGLAKLLEQAPTDKEAETRVQLKTQAGVVMGTVAYMSPEQARGWEVDTRTDIFSFGVVLYEMLARRQPFKGETISHTIVAILETDPPPVSQVAADCPLEVERIVDKALAKEPKARYQTAKELFEDLKHARRELEYQLRLERASSPDGKLEAQTQIIKAAMTAGEKYSTGETRGGNSIAVLPFANISADEENEYFCDGLAEELLNALSKIEDLKVVARTSAFSFKDKNANVSEIGEKLSVKTVLEGSVRKSGHRLRITVQLVNAADGYQLWSERYDRELKDIFELQDEITLAVIDELKLKLFGDKKAEVLKRYTENAEAYELFLKGRYQSYKYTAEGWKRAVEFFEKAIEIQPDYAPAYAGIAASRGCLWFFGILPAEQTVSQCKTANGKALELDERLAEAYLSSAMITFFYDWEWEKAEQEFKKSIALNPNNAEALSYYAMFLAFEERFDEADSLSKKSLKIDPLSPLINMNVGWNYFAAGRLDEAANQAAKMIAIEPAFHGAYWLKGAIYLSEGEFETAIEQLKKAVSLGGHPIVMADLGAAYSLAGRDAEAAAILDQLLETRRQQYVPAICLARIYSRTGENEKAIEWLEKAFAERNGEMVFLKGEIEGAAAGDVLHNLADDPRIINLLRKMNLPGKS